jgi:hypothetical protein
MDEPGVEGVGEVSGADEAVLGPQLAGPLHDPAQLARHSPQSPSGGPIRTRSRAWCRLAAHADHADREELAEDLELRLLHRQSMCSRNSVPPVARS